MHVDVARSWPTASSTSRAARTTASPSRWRDHIVVVDTPNNQARGEAVLAKAKEVIPNKPIRYVVTSHHHWDHLGGIRAAIDEGATIVTHESNKAFLERVAKTPHTIRPDRAGRGRRSAAKVQTVGDDGRADRRQAGDRAASAAGLRAHGRHAGGVSARRRRSSASRTRSRRRRRPGTPLIPPAVPSAKALNDNIKRSEAGRARRSRRSTATG